MTDDIIVNMDGGVGGSWNGDAVTKMNITKNLVEKLKNFWMVKHTMLSALTYTYHNKIVINCNPVQMKAIIYSNRNQECERAESLLKSCAFDELITYYLSKDFTAKQFYDEFGRTAEFHKFQ